jgi:uncharacterized protein YndB with AHSA1/START domain
MNVKSNARSDNRSETNSIERSILIEASRDKVWRALTNAENFGTWFGADLKGQTFAIGKRARGAMGTSCGREEGPDTVWFDIVVERIDPQDLFSYRWHPYAVVPGVDYSSEEPTLVTFTLKDAANNSTLITVLESGFDTVPPHRRAEAFRMHTGGWEAQLNNLAKHASA